MPKIKFLEIYHDNNSALFIAIISSLPLIGLVGAIISDPVNELQGYKQAPIIIIIPALLLCSVIFFLERFFNKAIQLKFDSKGVWHRKTGLLVWNNISSIFFEERQGKGGYLLLKVQTRHPHKEIKLNVGDLKTTEQEIFNVCEDYCKAYGVFILEKIIRE